MSNTASFNFVTTLRSLPQAMATISTAGLSADKVKKHARVTVSVEHTTPSLGFLHANLVRLQGRYFLFAGPSGVGKTAYATALGAGPDDILANDWVAVEYNNGALYASDLNEAGSMRHQRRCRIAGVFFLTPGDGLGRDAFAPTADEYAALLRETFDIPDLKPAARVTLRSFWLLAYARLPFVAAVPARRHSQSYTVETIRQLLAKATAPLEPLSVGVIGTGALGSQLVYQLGQLPCVNKVYLYNRDVRKAKGYAQDMNQALPNGHSGRMFAALSSAEEVLTHSSAVFLVFRDAAGATLHDVPERWQRLPGHAATIRKYAALAAAADFQGTIYVVTNPVDILSYALHATSQQSGHGLRTYQVYGIGLELDMARTLHFARRLDFPLSEDELTIFGNHSDDFQIVTPLAPKQQATLLQAAQGASAEIRAYGPRTVYGPVAAAIRTLQASVQDGPTYVTVLQEGTHIGRKIIFRRGLPQLADTPPLAAYDAFIRQNKAAIAAYSHLLYNA